MLVRSCLPLNISTRTISFTGLSTPPFTHLSDLKLDNILMTPEGHIKVADYGICKDSMPFGQTTRTFCGTPDYMAPEILLSNRYGRAVDWWSFGVLIFVMLAGRYPFHGDDENQILDAILDDSIEYPSNLPRETFSIINQV
jgi:novel protein kinase C epsilon type